MNCDKCGKGSSYLLRQNPTGEKGVFWCRSCCGLPEPEKKGEPMTPMRQLERWVKGESVHNSTTDECCPDFSCCSPNLLWPKEKRVAFAEASVEEDDEKTFEMLMGGLGNLLEQEGLDKDVRIAGDD